MASMGRSGRNAPICCSHGRAVSPTFACLPPSHSSRTPVVQSTEIVIAQQTPIAREDLAVSPALFPHGKQCIIRLESILLSGSLTPDPWTCVCALRGWLDFHASLQFSPMLVSRRPKKTQGEWGLVPDGVRVLLVEAESKLMGLKRRCPTPCRLFSRELEDLKKKLLT